MIFFKLISVQWWCIFILYSQRSDCASFFSAAEPQASSLSAAAVPSLCGEHGESSEQYVGDKGPSSSVLLALRPNHGRASAPCKRQFRAPDAYNFFVRLQRVPAAGTAYRSSAGKKKYSGNKASNSTNSCPLTISQSANGELLPSWRLDPCLLETAGLPDEPMRLLQGKLNIVWNHDGNAPNYRLHLTVVGQGAVCLERDKHSCLEYVGMPLLCIARELMCDGAPNCPPLGSDVSDENEAMCAKHRREEYSESPVQSVFRKYFQNTLKSFFGGEPDELPAGPAHPGASSTVDIGLEQQFGSFDAAAAPTAQPVPPATTEAILPPKKQHRSTLTGLSKYGPWGYLFLGMLICGGALLICGLWECCCRSHKPERSPDDSLPDPVPSFLQTTPGDGGAGPRGTSTTADVGHSAPHYGEIDPPPAYSVLFPNQKPSDADASGERPESASSPSSRRPAVEVASPVASSPRVATDVPDVETSGSHSRAGNEDPSEPDAVAPGAVSTQQDRL